MGKFVVCQSCRKLYGCIVNDLIKLCLDCDPIVYESCFAIFLNLVKQNKEEDIKQEIICNACIAE